MSPSACVLTVFALPLAIMLAMHSSLSTSSGLGEMKMYQDNAIYGRQAAAACPTFDDLDGNQGDDGIYTAPPTSTAPNTYLTATNGPISSVASSGPAASITPAPSLSCILQEEDPDNAITTPYCVCSSTTLPVLSVPSTGQQSDSCAYSTIPATGAVSITQLFPIVTNSAACEVCTLALDDYHCSPIAGCATSAAPTPSATVAVSKNNAHVGSLSGDPLYSAVFSALSSKCSAVPSSGVGSCDASAANIPNIGFVEGDDATEGTIVLTIEDSNYTSLGEASAMIGAVANALKTSATGNSCSNKSFAVTCPGTIGKRGHADLSVDDQLEPRLYDPPEEDCKGYLEVCDVANLYTVWVFNSGGIVASMNVEVSFDIDGFNMFDCEALLDALVAILDEVAPEVDVADWELLGEIEAWCGELTGGSKRDLEAMKVGLLS